ncbi:hypothetical protein APA73_00605 [Pseudomonas aeruginosa]|uniref:hypothetical protein n=1 Tax=Pseudomonas aeruginosa TaxID=287 RepID=UPI00044DBDAE|nr:hypothetical protein [Pseudomonas aeruginosa]ETV24897.1 hypothetical protein Q048_03821 [Pseudomonas aeruginosa BWHPSA043]KSL77194.1 hypothetical protein APA58_00605 [Pseudomonas aeruginosa]KSM91645.1 hypothetical protein APA73_00605 [Pseudomonas aeruginosa]MBO3771995.1 hypothetical protein [Pseudomonas aeruginosa]MCD2811304.1 hypothetical protein [Pseudomonas aeruginosa]
MKKLVFVYNGDSGLVNGVMHYLHKRISPQTYPCQLCGIIYDGLSLNRDWLAFVKALQVPTEYLHRDEYANRYGATSLAWPAVLLHDERELLAVVLSAEQFADIHNLDDLQERLGAFVEQAFGATPA